MSLSASQFADHFKQYSAALEQYASQWTSSAGDCVQEAFIQLAQQTKAPENVEAWLYRVVRNRALNTARADARRVCHERASAARLDHRPAGDAVVETIGTTDLERALEHLTLDLREIVVLRVWSGLTWQEIATLADTSSSSAQRHYVQALEQLRRELEKPCQTNSN